MALQPHSLVRHQLRVDDNGSLVQIEKKVITRVEVRQTGQKHAVSATGNQSKKQLWKICHQAGNSQAARVCLAEVYIL